MSILLQKREINEQTNAFRLPDRGRHVVCLPVVEGEDFRPHRRQRAKNVYLEQVSPLSQSVIDSAVLDKEGNYRFELKGVTRTPSLYNIIYNGERIPLFLAGGDRLSVNSVGSFIRNYTVEGSEESELLRRFYQPFVAGMQRSTALSSSPETYRMTDEEIDAARAIIQTLGGEDPFVMDYLLPETEIYHRVVTVFKSRPTPKASPPEVSKIKEAKI